MLNAVLRGIALVALLAPAASGQSLQERIEGAKRRVYPALVNIRVVSKSFSKGRPVRQPSNGSGTIISPAGHVITNYHVVQDAQRITCLLPSGEAIPAEILADDPAIDMSVLRLKMDEREDPNVPLPFATLGNSAGLEVGDHVLAMGNPMGLASSMTLGIVSNTERVFTDFLGNSVRGLDIGNRETGMFTRWIQHDALILPGNSGGPLVSLQGDIVGMNTRGGNGVSFATPAALLKKSIGQIFSYGEVRRGWMGLELQTVGRLGLREGALIAAVRPHSPAAASGIVPGDILLTVGETEIRCRHLEELPLAYGAIADCVPGHERMVHVRRGEEEIALPVLVRRRPSSHSPVLVLRAAGATVRDLTESYAIERRLSRREGVIVSGLRTGMPFEQAEPPIRSGDLLIALDGEPITSAASLRAALPKELDGSEVGIRLRRGDQDLISVVSFEKPSVSSPGALIKRAWMGIRTQVMTPPVAKAVGRKGQKGFRVTQVFSGTKAAEAGLLAGDILVAVDGEELEAWRDQDVRDLVNLLEDEYAVGDSVALRVLRGREALEIGVMLEASPATVRDTPKASSETFEFRVRGLRFEDRVANRWSLERYGVLVTEVTSGGWAAMAGLGVGDLIVAVNGRPVEDVAGFNRRLEEVEAARPGLVKLFVHRGNSTTFVLIEPDWD